MISENASAIYFDDKPVFKSEIITTKGNGAEELRGMQKAGRIRQCGRVTCVLGSVSKKRMAVSGWTFPSDAFFHVGLGGSISFLNKACASW